MASMRSRQIVSDDQNSHFNRGPRPGSFARQSVKRTKPAVERLELRRLLASITVTTADDGALTPNDGFVTLREAIQAIDAGNDLGDADIIAQTPGTFGSGDQIGFNIDGGGAQTISPTTELPPLSETVVLDASTQPGFAGTPLITIDGTGAGVSNGLTVAASGVIVRGFTVQNFTQVNPASGSGGAGIDVTVFTALSGPAVVVGNVITGNAFGIRAFGTYVIGGTTAADRNVISGNTFDGIRASDSSTSGQSRIQGNYIGVDIDGVTPLPNGRHGVINGAAGGGGGSFLVGGSIPQAGNLIAYNGGDGVSFFRGAVVRHNSIFSNGELGIDNVTSNANDPLDPDSQAFPGGEVISTRQNHPILASADSDGANVTVSGLINTNPFAPLLIDFYASDDPDSFGKSHGKTHLGTITVITDGAGNAVFAPTFAIPADAGGFITATATSTIEEFRAETSEFSAAVAMQLPPPVSADPPIANGYTDLKAAKKSHAFTGVVASFTSTAFNSANSFSATINWGDGTSSAGQIVFNSNTNKWDVIGTHSYAKKGKYSLLITIVDANGKTATATSKLTA